MSCSRAAHRQPTTDATRTRAASCASTSFVALTSHPDELFASGTPSADDGRTRMRAASCASMSFVALTSRPDEMFASDTPSADDGRHENEGGVVCINVWSLN